MSEEQVAKLLRRIERFVAMSREGNGAADSEREQARTRAEQLMAKLGLTWDDFAYVYATETTASARQAPPKRERASRRSTAKPRTTAQAKPQPKAQPKPETKPAGSKGRRDWTATNVKLGRQAIWDSLSQDEIVAHRQRMARTGQSSRDVAQAAWLQTIADGIASGSLALVDPSLIEFVQAWAQHSFAKAA